MIKCVVFDLDNVVWDGYCHDGPEGVFPRGDVVQLMHRLSDSGVLLSVSSKNAQSDATAAMKYHAIDSLVLYPQIGWEPKSVAIRRIAEELGINLDAVAFVDDEPAERAEVKEALPQVTIIEPTELQVALEPLFTNAASDEARRRKELYTTERERKQILALDYLGDFERFLRGSRIEIRVEPITSATITRGAELFGRSSRLNFAARKYEVTDVESLISSPGVSGFVVRICDRYGDYGVCGVAILARSRSRVTFTDIVFSCRVQGKAVERSFLVAMIEKCRREGVGEVAVRFCKTEFNSHLEVCLSELQFVPSSRAIDGTVQDYVRSATQPLPTLLTHPVIFAPSSPPHSGGIPTVRTFVREVFSKLPASARVLDVGAGWGDVLGDDWEEEFKALVPDGTLYRCDEQLLRGVDFVASAEDFACIKEHYFDVLLMLEVLEHTERFWLIPEQLARIVKAGGQLVVSAPFKSPVHNEPRDYFRFTPRGLESVFSGPFSLRRTALEGPDGDPIRTIMLFIAN